MASAGLHQSDFDVEGGQGLAPMPRVPAGEALPENLARRHVARGQTLPPQRLAAEMAE